jgi:hypothetical protein
MNTEALYNERELLLRVADSDEQAFRIIYDQYCSKILTISHKVLQTEAEVLDTLHEVFVKLWLNRQKLPEIGNFNAYLNIITRNHLIGTEMDGLYLLRTKGGKEIIVHLEFQSSDDPLMVIEWLRMTTYSA